MPTLVDCAEEQQGNRAGRIGMGVIQKLPHS